jgi:hypothetical protein
MPRFRFHGNAVGAAGRFIAPFDEWIPVQASAALPEIGGVASVRSGKFNYRGIFTFEDASSELIGRYDEQDRAYETLVLASVEKLNIMDMITADRIVARLVSIHPDKPDSEPSITPVGSYFENLRIAGYPLMPDLAVDTFAKLGTFASLSEGYQKNNEGARDLLGRMWARETRERAPAAVREYLPSEPSKGKFDSGKGVISCSLVRDLGVVRGGLVPCGHVIEIEGFGVIRLAEFQISRFWRRLTMLQVDLGSPGRAKMMAAGVEGDGTDW